jgi:hypothetical protein
MANLNLTTKNYDALLTQSAQAVLDSSGQGIAVCAPSGIGNVWIPIQVAVTCSGVSTPTGNLYIGPNFAPSALKGLLAATFLQNIGGTATANNDSIGFVSNLTVPFGQALIFQWTGGSSGGQAVMTVTGTQTAQYWR